jgi:hypothetical protein
MTVHENGKDIPCRVVKNWEQPDGARAFQLQIIASGEMLTLVEDGPATTYEGKAGKMRALSMRIFHWGNRSTSPPGVPVPPEQVITDQETSNQETSHQDTSKPIILSESDAHLICLTPDPVLPPGCKMCSPPTTVPGGNLACNPCSSCGPCSSYSGPGMAQNPGTGSFPYSQMPSGSKPLLASDPALSVAQGPTSTQGPQAPTVQGSNPGQNSGLCVGPKQVMATVPPQTSGPGNANAAPPATLAGQAGSLGQANAASAAAGTNQTATKPPATLGRKIKNLFHHPEQQPPAEVVQKSPAVNIAVTQNTQPGNTGVAQKTSAGTPAGTVASAPPATATGTSKNPSTLSNSQPLSMPNQTASCPSTTLPNALPTAQPSTIVPAPGMASTPASNSQRTIVSAPGMLPNLQGTNVATPGTAANPQANCPATVAAAPPGTANCTSPDNKTTVKKTTWEKIWGKPLFAKKKVPGQTPAGTGTQTSGTAVAAKSTPQSTQAFPAPTTKAVPGPDVPGSGTPCCPAGTLVNVGPTGVLPPAPPAAGSIPAPSGPTMFPPPLAQGKLPTPPASFVDSQKQNDPLLNPDQIKSSRVEAKTGASPPTPSQAKAQPKATGTGQDPLTAQAGGLQNQVPPLPMGSGSVMAAQNGLPIPYHYMPVPLVTVPNPLRNPAPPPPNVPVPPQPTAFVNAFSPARQPPKQGDGQQNPLPQNIGMGPFPYGPLPDPRLMGYPPQMMAQGMPPYPVLNHYMMPYMAQPQVANMPYMAQPQVANGPGMMSPYPVITPMGMQRPIAQVNYPSNYQGPMPPNPVIGSNLPAMYPQPMMLPAMHIQNYGNPAMDRPGMAPTGQGTGNVTHLLGLLRDSISPAEREMAALNLTNQDWRSHPEVVQGLVSSARQDPAATVRASCVRTLAVQNIATESVLTTLNALKNDPDPRVRQEVEQALVRLNGGQASVTTPALQPAASRP